ncbi:MAG: hypothetical protein EBR82_37335 [Caulobacteraceae bacterium]|nr:hypothetical protein [Caulobacteraceae bacterium]
MSISASAVLVELNISVWPATIKDEKISEQVTNAASAVADAGQFRKNLFAGTSLRKDIEKHAARARLYNNMRTLPWADKGERLLPTKLFMDYKISMNTHQHTFDTMCNTFFQNYTILVNQAQTNLRGLFNADDYPPLDEVKKKFAFNLTVKPVPESGDFRLDIPASDLAEIKQEFEDQQAQKLADAMRTPWERLHTMLTAMSDKLSKGKDADAKMRWHDSFISNPLELCQLLTAMNITNDSKLEEARKQLELTMLGANLQVLKEDVHAREDLKSKVDNILGKFNW